MNSLRSFTSAELAALAFELAQNRTDPRLVAALADTLIDRLTLADRIASGVRS